MSGFSFGARDPSRLDLCSGCGATQGAGHWPACPVVPAVLAFFEGLFRLHARPTVAALLADSSPETRTLVKGAFLDQARTHAPEWAGLIEADE